jgi:glucosyl-3-phosphoglycerate synthase
MHDGEWRSWFERRTFGPPDLDPAELLAAKKRAGTSLSVCLPTLDEERSVGDIVRMVDFLREQGLVDEIVVSDSGSNDATTAIASAAGATIVTPESVPEGGTPGGGGKGGAMWRGAAQLTGDIVCFLDADVLNFGPHFITRLIAPLLGDESIVMVKAFYRRPIAKGDGSLGPGGARVTEIALRPLLQVLYEQLTGFVQPLSGECAIRRDALYDIPLVSGYGVEAGMLVDVVQRHGLDAVAQVDLGTRVHRNRAEEELGETAFQVIEGFLMRLDDHGMVKLPVDLPEEYVRFDVSGSPQPGPAGVFLMPPLSEIGGRADG